MDTIAGIVHAITPHNLLFCFLGSFLGTLVGVLPGLGTPSTLAILLPLTMVLDPSASIIMLAGLVYGASYGGSTTSILVNIPGEVVSIVTCFDGFPMTKQGRAGQALWTSAVGSFIAGTFGCLMFSLMGPALATYALRFGPPEKFGLIFFSLTALISLSGASLLKGLGAGLLGIWLSSIGVDPSSGVSRFSFGSTWLLRGVEIIPVTVGLCGISEILESAEAGIRQIYEGKLGKMMPRGRELTKALRASMRGTLVGFFPALLPGLLPGMLSFVAYDLEKRLSKYPEKFGTGVIEGVASPEACNNAAAQAGFIPLMSLGIPTGPSNALLLAALILAGLQPGPLLFTTNKEIVWTIIGSMYVGQVMCLVLNLPLIGFWARISMVPYKYLGPTILAICLVGAYSPRNTMFDVWVALGAGVVGYFMRKNDWPVAPLILGFILGPMLEQALRQSVSMGGFLIFFRRPIPLAFILFSIIMTTLSLRYRKRSQRIVSFDD